MDAPGARTLGCLDLGACYSLLAKQAEITQPQRLATKNRAHGTATKGKDNNESRGCAGACRAFSGGGGGGGASEIGGGAATGGGGTEGCFFAALAFGGRPKGPVFGRKPELLRLRDLFLRC